MSGFKVDVDLDLDGAWAAACRTLVDGLRHDVKEAAEEGAEHAQAHHPYQDRTYHLTDTATGKIESSDRDGATGAIVWPMDYASYVDKGTSRSKPYPFADEAERIAGEALERKVMARVEATLSRLHR